MFKIYIYISNDINSKYFTFFQSKTHKLLNFINCHGINQNYSFILTELKSLDFTHYNSFFKHFTRFVFSKHFFIINTYEQKYSNKTDPKLM